MTKTPRPATLEEKDLVLSLFGRSAGFFDQLFTPFFVEVALWAVNITDEHTRRKLVTELYLCCSGRDIGAMNRLRAQIMFKAIVTMHRSNEEAMQACFRQVLLGDDMALQKMYPMTTAHLRYLVEEAAPWLYTVPA